MEERIVFDCHTCGRPLRYPFKEVTIRFSCPTCRAVYEASNGMIVVDVLESENVKNNSHNPTPNLESRLIRRLKTRTLVWQGISTFLIILLLTLIGMYFMGLRPEEKLTRNFLAELRYCGNGDFDRIKTYFTKDTKQHFEFFIESQYVVGDTSSIRTIERYISTFKPHEYSARRRFTVCDLNGDTISFFVDYTKVNDSLKMDINLSQFVP